MTLTGSFNESGSVQCCRHWTGRSGQKRGPATTGYTVTGSVGREAFGVL
jgi:hypothetical protein